MNKHLKRFLIPLVILLLGISVSGCAPLIIGGAVGAVGGYEYKKGQDKEKKGTATQSKDTTSNYSTGTTNSH